MDVMDRWLWGGTFACCAGYYGLDKMFSKSGWAVYQHAEWTIVASGWSVALQGWPLVVLGVLVGIWIAMLFVGHQYETTRGNELMERLQQQVRATNAAEETALKTVEAKLANEMRHARAAQEEALQREQKAAKVVLEHEASIAAVKSEAYELVRRFETRALDAEHRKKQAQGAAERKKRRGEGDDSDRSNMNPSKVF